MHDMEQVESLCHAVALVHKSRLVFAGIVSELRGRHQRSAVLWAAAKVYRAGILLYGTRPSLLGVLRMVRSA